MSVEQHRYPSLYPPGSHWSIDEAWAILDRLPPGMLPDEWRFLLAGIIAGTLQRVAADAARGLS
jgi:hypothetical protein